MKKVILSLISISVLIGLAYFVFNLYPKFPIANGYAAKKMCSLHFISGISPSQIEEQDLGFAPLDITNTIIDEKNKTVTSTIFGMGAKTAVYRNKLGCILLDGEDDFDLNYIAKPHKSIVIPELVTVQHNVKGVNYNNLGNLDTIAFSANGSFNPKRTLALAVFYKDSLIYEKYAAGYGINTPILGWSMTKSVTATLLGILIKNNFVSLDDTELFSYWEDERKNISINDLLQMQSGLSFDENYSQVSDATEMLFMSENMVEIASNKHLKKPIGSHWSYSSGTSNIISGIIRNNFTNLEHYHAFPYDSLFNRVGTQTAVLETDEAGNFIGSSYMYASARDWGRLGLLYLNNGNWYGDQILDSSFVDFIRKPASNSGGYYGGHFWQNHNQVSFSEAPNDTYFMSGFEGQNVIIIPSHDLVIVRLALNENFNLNTVIKQTIKSIDKQ